MQAGRAFPFLALSDLFKKTAMLGDKFGYPNELIIRVTELRLIS